ncbi:MAG: PH domain-containing protein [Patescibacteria group bacterium]|nr:PH domain-containing protein [Patescibacteria group bacterium]
MAIFSLRLYKNEEVLAIIRRHFTTFFGPLFRFLIILSVILSLHYFLPSFRYKLTLIIIFFILAVIYLGYLFVVWYLVNIVITTQRIIDINQKGLTKRVVTEISLEDISKISSLKEGVFQNLFNVGSLIIEVKEGGKIVGFAVKNPQDIMSRLNQLRRDNEKIQPNSKRSIS